LSIKAVGPVVPLRIDPVDVPHAPGEVPQRINPHKRLDKQVNH
jgi:hypothetical protein